MGAELSRPPPLVAPGSCSSRAARRGVAGAEPCCNPSCTAARPPRPRATRSRRPPRACSRRPGVRRGRAAAERGEVAGREAGCSTASLSAGEELRLPFVSKSKHCPLLFRPRQRARHTGSHTSCSCRVLGVFREGARRAEPPLGKFPRLLSKQGAPGGPQGARLAAEAANAPSATLGPPKGRAAGKSCVPTRGGGRRGAGGLRAPGACPQRRRQRLPPRGAGPGEVSLPGAGPGRPAAQLRGRRGCDRPEGNTRGVQFGDREKGRARGAGQGRADKSGDVLGTGEESRRRWLVVSPGEA